MIKRYLPLLLAAFLMNSAPVRAEDSGTQARLKVAQSLYQEGDFLKAARYYFSVYTDENFHGEDGQILAMITDSLLRAKFPQTAAYFYIKTLQSSSVTGKKRILRYLPRMVEATGIDILKNHVIRYTKEEDYDTEAKNVFFYALGKDKLLKGDTQGALDALKKVSYTSSTGAAAAQLRASAHAILNQADQAIDMFKVCERNASRRHSGNAEDLEYRCMAGRARVLYQIGKHDEAEEVYDDIPKKSFVWTDILFEQAWNAYAKADYNRALGKLVTYRSPHLGFVFNPEVEVLRAQSFLALCLQDDVNKTINEFNSSYQNIGETLKNQLLNHSNDYFKLFAIGKETLQTKLHTNDMLKKALNRSVRGPYFAALVQMEAQAFSEQTRLRTQIGDSAFVQFLDKVTNWRVRSVRLLGGIFVRNSMVDLYNDLLGNLDKMSYIKSEMLSKMKTALTEKRDESDSGDRKRGSTKLDRKDYQYYWSFNGEFWNDELGDYVFALESQCR